MPRSLLIAGMAPFALAALIMTATASASPVLTHPTGTKPSTASELTGTNVGETILRSGETVLSRCTKATMTGYLTKNNGEEVEGTIHTATFSGTGSTFNEMPECTSGWLGSFTFTTNGGGIDGENVENGTPWCMRSTVLGKFTVRGGSCNQGSRAITFIMDGTTAGECKYSRSTAIEGTYTTDSTGDAIFNLTAAGTEFKLEAGGFFCPASPTFEMSFTMETEGAKAEPSTFRSGRSEP